MRLKEKAKRVLATVMALSMMFSSMSTAVFATGTEPTPPEGELIVEQTQQSAVTVNWGETPAESISPSLTLSFTTGAEGETPVVQELTAEENWTATYQLPYSETAYTLTVSGVPEGFAAAVSAVEGGYAVSIVAAEAQQQSEENEESAEQPETPTADLVQELYDTLMAFESYDELSDYMDNMTEEQYALLSQFSEEQTAALQAHTQTLSENAQEMLPEVNETELNKVKRELPNKLMQHLDVRLPGATITITTELVDYISGTTISTGVPRTIAAQVNQVHSITLTNFYRYTRYGTQWENSYTYTDFERNVDAVIENRQNTNFYVTQNTTATVTVDLIDNDDNIYENVVLTYNYDGIARAAMNCDTYVKYDGSYYGGLDFNPATNTEFTSRYINYVIPVVKVWNDTGYEHLRPDDLTIKLQSSTSENGPWTDTGKTLTLNAANEWKGSFENLDYQNDSLQRIYYKVVEELPANSNYEQTGFDTIDDYIYVVGDNRPSIAAYRFTNTPTSVDIPVTKVWADNNNQDGKRPTSITVNLVEVGASIPTATIELTAANGWKGEFTNVDPSKEYTVTEENLPEGYTLKPVEGSNSTGYTVTNTYAPETVDLIITKKWVDENGNELTGENLADLLEQEQINLSSVGFHIRANGALLNDGDLQEGQVKVGTYSVENNHIVVSATAGSSWKATVTRLPKYHNNGQLIDYVVVEHEDNVLGMHFLVESIVEKETNNFIVTNKYDPQHKQITVLKEWGNDANRSDSRPEIYVQLYVKNNDTWEVVENSLVQLQEDTGYSHTWSVLVNDDRAYNVVEMVKNSDNTYSPLSDGDAIEVDGGKYVVSYSSSTSEGTTDRVTRIKNTFEVDTTSITAKKVWNGTSAEVTINLLANGEQKASITLDGTADTTTDNNRETGPWTATFANLPKTDDYGKTITYTVEEAGVTNGKVILNERHYAVEVKQDHANGGIWVITNTELTSVKVKKVWSGDEDYGKRPSSITVKLMEGTTEVQSAVLNAANSWTYTFTDLIPGDYRVEEVIDSSWDEFYNEPVIEGDAANGYTITNTINEDAVKVKLIINKTWYGDENKIDWSAVKFLVRQNGTLLTENEDYTVTTRPTSGTTGQFVIEGLPKYDSAGHEYIYTLREDTSGLEGWVVSSLVQTADTEHTYSLVNIQTMRIGLRKIWDDNNNQDGLRPDKLTFTLYQNDDLFYSGSIDVSGDVYENMWINLPRFDANGKEYTYTVAEEPVTGYTTVPAKLTGESSYNNVKYNNDRLTFNGIPYDVAYVAQFINTHNPETVSYNVYKTWIDANNQDGKRPGSLSVGIFNGETLVQVVTLNHDNDWEGKFTNLPKYANGEEIKYSAYELVVDANGTYELDGVRYRKDTQGYTASGDGPVSGSINLTNTYTPATTAVTVTKVWEDANNQDGKRPETTAVKLMKGDMQVAMIVLDGTVDDNGETKAWEATFANLPKYENGVEINYTVQEVGISANNTITFSTGAIYTVTTSGDELTGYTITNSYTPETTSVTVKKVWDDNNNQDGKRPGSITVKLLANGNAIQTVTLSAANNWTATVENLQKYAGGQQITYAWKETTIVNGYTATNKTDGNTTTITNTYTPELINIRGSKVWNDANNQDGKRPSSVTINLLADGTIVKELHVTRSTGETNEWGFVFENLPKYANGTEIVYTVTEDAVADYTTVITGDATAGYTVTNTHTPETVTVKANKVWDKVENKDYPDTITVYLYANGKKVDEEVLTVNAESPNDMSATFSNLPKYAGGALINYEIVEGSVTNFDTSITPITENATAKEYISTITNTYAPNRTSVTVIKDWVDGHDQDGKRPDFVKVQLYANGLAYGQPAIVNAEGGWTYTFTDLAMKDSNGNDIEYTISELNENDTPIAAGGKNGVYTVTYNGMTIVNTYEPEKTEVTVTKNWDDANDQDGKRPESIVLRLWANGQEVSHIHLTKGAIVTPNVYIPVGEDGVWDHTFTNLPVYQNGVKIVYTVTEDEAAGYKTVITGDATVGYTVTNTHTPETTSVSGAKTWVDQENTYGTRPESITVYLYANGVLKTSVPVRANANGEWKYSFTNLPVYADGQKINYTVEEAVVPAYSTTYNGYDIINTLPTIDVPVSKVWDDDNNRDGLRPGKIILNLVDENNTNKVISTLELSGTANVWDGIFEDVPKYNASGEEIKYIVTETNVVDYELSKIEMTQNGRIIATNTHTPETVSITVTKNWDDANDQDGQRPSSVTIHLMANGYRVTGVAKTLTKDGNWTATWDNLPKKANGVDIVYTVDEDSVAGYEKSYDYGKDSAGNAYTSVAFTVAPNSTDDYHGKVTVTNIHVPETITISGTKTWLDDDDQYGLRPSDAAIEVILQSGEEKKQAQQYQVDQDGNFVKDTDGYVLETVEPATANAANNWTYSFINLPKYEPDKVGVKIEYTVTDNVLNYTAEGGTVVGSSNDKQANLINRLTESVDLTVEKVWDDQDNKYGTRPDEITVTVKANGADLPKGGTITLDASNNWKHTFENLPKYSAENVEYEYTVVETAVTGYVPTYKQGENVLDSTDRIVFTNDAATVTVLNTLETIDIGNITNVGNAPAEKVWNDNDATEALRPDTITVKVFDGDEEVASQEVTDENATADGKTWRYEFLDLPKYKEVNGVKTEIAYTVKEILPQDYEDVYNTSNSGYVITNTPATVEIAVEKVWDTTNTALYDASVDSVVFKVLNGDTEVASVTLSEGKWKHTFTDLPKFEMKEGKPTEIAYKVVEEVVKGYEPSYTGADNDGVVTLTDVENSKNATGSVIIKNTLIENKISINKAWVGDRASWRPDDIDVNVVYNDKVVDTITLTEANNWTAEYTWYGSMEGLRFEEKDVPGSYISSKNNYPTLVGGTEYEVTITNTYYEYEPDEGDQIVVRKVWVGGDEENRPEVKIQLYKNGRKYRKEAELSESKHYSENWRYVWDDVTADKYTEWDVKEIDVPAGYVSTVTKVNDYYFIVTNTWVDEKPMPNTGK